MKGVESVDVYSHDLENGYTPLHVTLKNGHLRKSYTLYKRWKNEMEFLSHKFGGHVLNQMDREGLKPLELYNIEFQTHIQRYPRFVGYGKEGSPEIAWQNDTPKSSLNVKNSFMSIPADIESEVALQTRGGSHILTLGSNVNYQLGTGTKDDRQNMFQLGINQLSNHETDSDKISFIKIIMTRYHSIVLTSTNKIFTCGNASRGRLGNGITDTPQLNFTETLDLHDSGVSDVVSSNHHSLVLTNNSDIYSWGWNGYGQLGYPTNNKINDEKLLEKVCGSVPKRIPFFDDKDVLTIACSKVHSCAVTKTGRVYLWGLNLGQMGGPKPTHLSPDTEYEGQNGYIISSPVCINLSHLSIQQIVCTDFATFIRSSNNTLHVYSNYMFRTFKIPLPRAKTFKEIDAFAHFAPREIPSEVVDMKCSNSFGNNICFKYTCGRVGMITMKDESSKIWTKFPNSLPVTICWIPNIQSRKCLDFAVSCKGCLLITTLGGDVFTVTASNFTAEQIYSNKLVSGRPIGVSCDPSFGSFAILKDERFEVPIIYPKDNLIYDLSQYSPLSGISPTASATMRGFSSTLEFKLANYHYNFEINEKVDELAESKRDIFSLLPFTSQHLPKFSGRRNSDLKYDVTIVDPLGKPILECHKLILQNRCSKLKQSLIGHGRFITRDGCLQISLLSGINDGNWILQASSPNISPLDLSKTLKQIVHFLYTDEKPHSLHIPKLLFELMDSSYHLTQLSHSMQRLLYSSVIQEGLEYSGDVILELKDGFVCGHSLLLSSRCLFFQKCLKDQWRHTNNEGLNVIKLDNVESASTFNINCILKYIYGVPYNEILDKIKFDQETEYIQFYLEMLELCDQLDIECFKNYVEGVIVKYMNGETAVPILVNAVNSNSRLLAVNCCWYICTHVGLLFIKDNIDIIEQYFDDTIWELLEGVLKELKYGENKDAGISWYEDASTNWLKYFQANLEMFNERFMDPRFLFIPVFDFKSDTTENLGRRNKKSNRRRSSNYSFNKIQQHSVICGDSNSARKAPITSNTSNNAIPIRKNSWNFSEIASDNEAVIDTEEFIDVVKKSKRRMSSQAPHVVEAQAPVPSSKVVVHKSKETAEEDLPSLLPSTSKSVSPSPVFANGNSTSNAKITGAFKKESQKQRRKQLTDQETKQEPRSTKKTVWGGPSSPSVTNSVASSGRKSLPSLYDDGSTGELTQTKKEKKKMAWSNSTNTEFVSHGNLSGITPYLYKVSMAQSATSTSKPVRNAALPEAPPKPKLSLEERVAAQEFEKWFAEESAKVQTQLKNDKRKARDEMQLMYNAANNLPDSIIGSSEFQTSSKKGRKLNLKFQNKNKDKSLIRTLQ